MRGPWNLRRLSGVDSVDLQCVGGAWLLVYWLLHSCSAASHAARTSYYPASTVAVASTITNTIAACPRRDVVTFQSPANFTSCRGGPQPLACCNHWSARGWSSSDDLLAAMPLSEMSIA